MPNDNGTSARVCSKCSTPFLPVSCRRMQRAQGERLLLAPRNASDRLLDNLFTHNAN